MHARTWRARAPGVLAPLACPLPPPTIKTGGTLIPALVLGSCLDASIFLLIPALVPGSCLDARHNPYLFKGVSLFV